jgi:hypothetical protein
MPTEFCDLYLHLYLQGVASSVKRTMQSWTVPAPVSAAERVMCQQWQQAMHKKVIIAVGLNLVFARPPPLPVTACECITLCCTTAAAQRLTVTPPTRCFSKCIPCS